MIRKLWPGGCCVPLEQVRATAHALAQGIVGCAPLAVASTRATIRLGMADRIAMQTEHELAEQNALRLNADWSEGVKATAERRSLLAREARRTVRLLG